MREVNAGLPQKWIFYIEKRKARIGPPSNPLGYESEILKFNFNFNFFNNQGYFTICHK
jgi:hypothetical protein